MVKEKTSLREDEKQAIARKLQDVSTDITSYVELYHWAESKFEKQVPYHVIYNYCHSRLNSRLIIARKSHYKKDEQAVEAFQKTPMYDRDLERV